MGKGIEFELAEQSELSEESKKQVLELWNQEYPLNLAHSSVEDFNDYLSGLSNPVHILAIGDKGSLCGWYCGFERDGEMWFAIILHADAQGAGLGTLLLEEGKRKAKELNAWVIDHNRYLKRNGEVYQSPLGFYKRNGFEELSQVRLEGDGISAVKIKWAQE